MRRNGGQMFAFNIEILKKSFPNDVQTKGSHRVARIRRTPLIRGLFSMIDMPSLAIGMGRRAMLTQPVLPLTNG